MPVIKNARIWVNSKNQAWAAKVSGMTLEEVSRLYQEARAAGYICTLPVPIESANQAEGEH